ERQLANPPSSAGSIAETDPDSARRFYDLAFRRDEPQPMNRFGDRHREHLVLLIADHLAEKALMNELDSFYAKARAEDAVQGGRRPASLQVSEDACSRLFTRSRGDFSRDDVADAPQPVFAW